MKRFELFFTALQLPIDYLLLLLAGFTAYALRFAKFVTAVRPVIFNLPWSHYWPTVLVVALGWIAIFAVSGLYSTDPNRKLARDLTRVVTACSTGFAAITIYVFFTLQKFDSRFLVLASWLLAILYVSLGRIIMRGLKGILYRAGIGLRRVVIVGNKAVAEIIKRTLENERRLGFHVVGYHEHFDERLFATSPLPDEILFTDPKAHENEALAAIDFANEHHITFKYSADLFATIATNMSVSTVAGIPIIELRRTRLTGWGRITKRLVDVILGFILLIICIPFYIIIAIAVAFDSGGPIIYKNQRVGQYGKTFMTLKFRTMYQKYCTGSQFGSAGDAALAAEAELIKSQNAKTGPVYKVKNDPRLTRVGRFLRRWSLDELPQFWNVLIGEMSLVGPRPHQPREVAQYEKRHKIVLTIKPGLSGLAQISGRSDLSFEDEVRLDAFYIENWNVYLDFIILVKTPFIVLKRTGSVV